MSRSRRPRRWGGMWWMPKGKPSVKQIENRRGRTLERNALNRGDELPLRDAPWMRWNVWNWD